MRNMGGGMKKGGREEEGYYNPKYSQHMDNRGNNNETKDSIFKPLLYRAYGKIRKKPPHFSFFLFG
jgi:hypothetical protein